MLYHKSVKWKWQLTHVDQLKHDTELYRLQQEIELINKLQNEKLVKRLNFFETWNTWNWIKYAIAMSADYTGKAYR
jgi:hypothetical protein